MCLVLSCIHAVEVSHQAQVCKWVFVFFWQSELGTNNFECLFGSQFFVTRCGEVIDLSDCVDHLTIVCGVMNGLIMNSGWS